MSKHVVKTVSDENHKATVPIYSFAYRYRGTVDLFKLLSQYFSEGTFISIGLKKIFTTTTTTTMV